MVDFVVFVVPPGSGDSLQAAKKGVMEIADLIVVNKFDSEYERSCRLLRNQLETTHKAESRRMGSTCYPCKR